MENHDRDREYITRIIEYCNRIRAAQERFGNTYTSFTADSDYRDVVNMNLFQIGELANQISDEAKEQYPDVPWHQMYGIRNILAHAYINIDDRIVWETVEKDIPALILKLSKIYQT